MWPRPTTRSLRFPGCPKRAMAAVSALKVRGQYDTAPAHAPLLVSQAPSPVLRPGNDTASVVMEDPRFRLFQALFALIEDDPPASAALVPDQLAEASFGVVSDVDDFTRP